MFGTHLHQCHREEGTIDSTKMFGSFVGPKNFSPLVTYECTVEMSDVEMSDTPIISSDEEECSPLPQFLFDESEFEEPKLPLPDIVQTEGSEQRSRAEEPEAEDNFEKEFTDAMISLSQQTCGSREKCEFFTETVQSEDLTPESDCESKSFTGHPQIKKRTEGPRRRSLSGTAKRLRKQVPCPVDGCKGLVQKIRVHLAQMHSDLPKWKHKELMAGNKPAKSDKRIYPIRACPSDNCQWQGRRVDQHLTRCHNVNPKERGDLVKRAEKVVEEGVQGQACSLNSLISDFAEHLQVPDGGKRTNAQALMHGSRIRNVCEGFCTMAGVQIFNSRMLKNIEWLGSANGLFTKWAHKYTSGTLANYVSSVKLLLSFLLRPSGRKYLIEWGTDQDVHTMQIYLRNLSLTYRNERSLEENVRHRKNMDVHIDTDLVGEYLSTQNKVFDDVVKKAQEFNPPRKFGQKELCKEVLYIRDHLLLRSYLSNGRRAGDLINMTMLEFENIQDHGRDHVVVVDRHKTKAKYHCRINFRGILYEGVKSYVKNVRQYCKQEGSIADEVFVNTVGRPMDASSVNKAINGAWAAWCQYKGVDYAPISTSLVRGEVTTKVRDLEGVTRDQELAMAAHLCHSAATSDRHYDRSLGLKKTLDSTALIRQAYGVVESEQESDSMEVVPPAPPTYCQNSSRDHKIDASSQEKEEVLPGPKEEDLQEDDSLQRRMQGCKKTLFTKVDVNKFREAITPYLKRVLDNGAVCKSLEALDHLRKAGPSYQYLFDKYGDRLRDKVHHIKILMQKERLGPKPKIGRPRKSV